MALPPPPLLLLLLAMLASRAPAAAQQLATLHERDAAALRDLRASLRDLPGSRFFDTWDDARSPCAYAGVVCTPSDDDDDDDFSDDSSSSSSLTSAATTTVLRVSVLTLGTGLADSPGLAGALPDSLSTLAALTDLVLYPGRVTGPIPPSIGAGLRRLRLLSLAGNALTGPVPPTLASLPDLHTLDLGGNRLSGALPPGLLLPGSCPSLKVLVLADNGGVSGEIPAGGFRDSGLFHVDLARNAIGGELPPLPGTLRYLSVAGNAMQGTLGNAFSGDGDGDGLPLPPAGLAFLDLSMNNFSGAIPATLFALPDLSSVLLSRNNFTGALSVPATTMEWSVVDVSHNALSGEVPEALAAAGSLYVNNNRLSGEVPLAVARSVAAGRMTTLYAQHNFLTGFPFPVDAGAPLPDSAALCLSYNCMDLPSAAAAEGCPTIGGPLQARPAEQCRSRTSGGGGDG